MLHGFHLVCTDKVWTHIFTSHIQLRISAHVFQCLKKVGKKNLQPVASLSEIRSLFFHFSQTLICIFLHNCCHGQSVFDLTFPDTYKMHHVERECCIGVKKEPLEPLMIGHQLLMWSCRGCLCLSVLHSGTCGLSYRMFYCSTMFLPWSSAHCIKTTLSSDAHTGRVCLIVHTHTHPYTG